MDSEIQTEALAKIWGPYTKEEEEQQQQQQQEKEEEEEEKEEYNESTSHNINSIIVSL